jgi:cell shape-determining protein MreD
MTRLIPYLLYLLLVGLHQVILKDVTMIYNAAINVPAFLVLAIAIYKSETSATWFGFLVGVVLAGGMHYRIGWHALILASLALATFHFRQRLNLDSMYSRVMLITGGVFVYNILALVVDQPDAFIYQLWSNALLGAVYTALVVWGFFLFKDGKITFQKLKAIF